MVLTPHQEYIVETFQDDFKSLGFDLRKIKDTWHLIGIPQIRNIILGKHGTTRLIIDFEELLVKMQNSNVIQTCSRLERFYASKACRSAVMIGDPLTLKKMNEIVWNMGELNQPWNCPHGRPTMRVLTIISNE